MMHRILTTSALALAGLAAFSAPALAGDKPTGEEELAKLLEGRVAGEARSCISTFRANRLRIIDGTALVYDDGRTLWVNVPRNPEALDEDDVLVTYPTVSQLCRLDRVELRDRVGLWFSGALALGDFVPYRKPG